MSSSQNPDTDNMNLDKIINDITNDSEFKEMMGSLTSNLSSKLNEDHKQSDSEKSNGVSDNESMESDSDLSYFDLLTQFFTDSQGNNICDILTDINKNLKTIANKK
jgi:hypothetical protein